MKQLKLEWHPAIKNYKYCLISQPNKLRRHQKKYLYRKSFIYSNNLRN